MSQKQPSVVATDTAVSTTCTNWPLGQGVWSPEQDEAWNKAHNLCTCGPLTVGEGLCECGARPELAPLKSERACDNQPCVEGCPRVACK